MLRDLDKGQEDEKLWLLYKVENFNNDEKELVTLSNK